MKKRTIFFYTRMGFENGYPADVLLSCINQKLANFAAEQAFGPEKCSLYVKLHWIGNASLKFQNQINKAITSCFHFVKPCVAYNTRVMLPSAKEDSVPTQERFSAEKSRMAMAPGTKERKGGLEKPLKKSLANFFSPCPFCPKKTPYFSTEIGHLYTKKDSKQNDREIEYKTIT